MQIGVVLLGEWYRTRKPLEYLILYLNTKQNIFEYQLIPYTDSHEASIEKSLTCEDTLQLVRCLKTASVISFDKPKLKHCLNVFSNCIHKDIRKNFNMFSDEQVPFHFLFISPAKHSDENFFQMDGTNGYTDEGGCRGGLIITGHHKKTLAPPTVIEFIFKFIFRISVKWKYTSFTRNLRHYGQKGCLFDYTNDLSLIRYVVLHNFICQCCTELIGEDCAASIKDALDPSSIYADTIDRHPAKISSKLGFNLSLTRGIYKSRLEVFSDVVRESFAARAGSVLAVGIIFIIALAFGIDTFVINED